ncbi:MAG TPA: S8 family serine peptidase [Candidatus Bathyarchaeia archaeon]|nr:S8 family serine peptidase [Candidatus Bathyarchaeia archaeon]
MLPLAALLLAAAAAAAPPSHDAKIADWLARRLDKGGDEPFIVLFTPIPLEGVKGRAVYDRLRTRAATLQAEVRRSLDEAGIPYRSLYIVNGLAVRGNRGLARALAARAEVVRIVGDPVVRGIEGDLLAPAAPDTIEWGVSRINADDVWTLDADRGEGIVVASADTGVEWTHAAIKPAYRGWNGTAADHDYNWFDPIDGLTAPIDDSGHGTHTTGTMVGDDGAGNQVGVAPKAKWIGCRNMDHGNGTPSTYIACNQFFLAPFPIGGDAEHDGDPSKAPDVVNNSWGCPPSEGCDAGALQESFAALRAAGILAVVSAGNAGPNCSTVNDPPSIYEESFVVGASDSSNRIAGFSSRGPVTLDGSGRLRPDVAAPGVNIRSSTPGGGYGFSSGTSMASPHVSGAVALLWSEKPQVRGLVDISRCLLSRSASTILTAPLNQTCGNTTATDRPNNFWGYGLVDVYAAIHLPDGDADGIADACDCAAGVAGAFDEPGAVVGLGVSADKTTLSWDGWSPAAGSGTVYDVVRGDLAILRETGTIAGAGCLGAPGTAASITDVVTPASGSGFYYVVQARNTCAAGGWSGARSHATCP